MTRSHWAYISMVVAIGVLMVGVVGVTATSLVIAAIVVACPLMVLILWRAAQPGPSGGAAQTVARPDGMGPRR